MKIFLSQHHEQHAPPYCLADGGVHAAYFESPQRIEHVLNSLGKTSWAKIEAPSDFGLDPILAVHDRAYVEFLRDAFDHWIKYGAELGLDYVGPILTPATFIPRRANARLPESFHGRLGYYGTDTNAPIVAGTFAAALQSAHCSVAAAQAVRDGARVAFSLARPPGHHAGRDYNGGFCYLNNASIAATWLSKTHRVAILDIDFHVGNGSQDIFYNSSQVLTVSIHGDPRYFYPSFIGYADERGSGEGLGFHRNFPLSAGVADAHYLEVLSEALREVQAFEPTALVLSAGMDILAGDPFGGFEITMAGLSKIGQNISALKLPTVICMEGGYNHAALGEGFRVLLETFN